MQFSRSQVVQYSLLSQLAKVFDDCKVLEIYQSYISVYANFTAMGVSRDPVILRSLDEIIRASKFSLEEVRIQAYYFHFRVSQHNSIQVNGKYPLDGFLALPAKRITRYFEVIAQLAVMLESSAPLESQRLHQLACSWNDLSTIANQAYGSAEVCNERSHSHVLQSLVDLGDKFLLSAHPRVLE